MAKTLRQMPVEFSVFDSFIKDKRPKVKTLNQQESSQPANIFAAWTKNNVKVEIAVKTTGAGYVVGQGCNPENLDILKAEIQKSGLVLTKTNAKHMYVGFADDVLAGFYTLFDIVENIEELVQYQRSNRFYQAQYDDNVFLYVAADIFSMLKYRPPGSPWKRGKIFDDIDKMIKVGYSVKGRESELLGLPLCREHPVPIDWCINKAFTMAQNGSSVEDVADMFKRNIKIVIISQEEQRILDVDMKMKTAMPDYWDDGDDVFARLKAAGIVLESDVISE